jgi:hypothetical protein
MELDDLRSQWRQVPLPPATPPAQLAGMLGRATGSLTDRMRRNTWYEIIASPLITALPLFMVPGVGFKMLYLGVMLPLLTLMGFYYARQLRLLQQMSQVDASLHEHLQRLCQGLRQLLAFYYRLTYWTGTSTLLILLGYIAVQELRLATGPPRWLTIGLVLGIGLLLGLWVQLCILSATRQFLQRMYGQHLDRLEGQLRELDEPAVSLPPGTARS